MALLPAKQKDIPLGKALCDKLGFVRGTARHQHVLLDSIRAWRKNYYTSSGVPAIELQNWSNEEVRVELKLLVIQFLNSSDHAERLWPANGFESPRFVPEYPEDKDRIVSNLTQLVWRQNVNDKNNDRNYHSHKQKENQPGASDLASRKTSSTSTRPTSSLRKIRVRVAHGKRCWDDDSGRRGGSIVVTFECDPSLCQQLLQRDMERIKREREYSDDSDLDMTSIDSSRRSSLSSTDSASQPVKRSRESPSTDFSGRYPSANAKRRVRMSVKPLPPGKDGIDMLIEKSLMYRDRAIARDKARGESCVESIEVAEESKMNAGYHPGVEIHCSTTTPLAPSRNNELPDQKANTRSANQILPEKYHITGSKTFEKCTETVDSDATARSSPSLPGVRSLKRENSMQSSPLLPQPSHSAADLSILATVEVLIIKTRHPIEVHHVWLNANLATESLQFIFEKVGATIGRHDFQSLSFRLVTLSVIRCIQLERGQQAEHKSMLQGFLRLVRRNREQNVDGEEQIEIEAFIEAKS